MGKTKELEGRGEYFVGCIETLKQLRKEGPEEYIDAHSEEQIFAINQCRSAARHAALEKTSIVGSDGQ